MKKNLNVKPGRALYKPVRFENGDGKQLTVCEICAGSGIRASAEKTTTNTAGRDKKEAKEISGNLIRMFRKNGWGVRAYQCDRCKGAGTHMVEEAKQ
ncbi:hypothetical protein [Mesorhizobium sp. B2-3-4]|uniref:hypothetical protein n=1 Tax=Mesorhizobium sp. B2-3-4 TaxID=2589959 RepID=UPI0011297E9D|nr:hypothetical protein [Mesorhizobium sp. B2-3-4]TPM41403.1 hypothetical protein FJ967_00250 [Mesorhizobium sp. B2-3-4]